MMTSTKENIDSRLKAFSDATGIEPQEPHVTAVDDFNRSLRALAEAVQHLDGFANNLKGCDAEGAGEFGSPIDNIKDIITITPGMMREIGHRIDKIREEMVTTLKMA